MIFKIRKENVNNDKWSKKNVLFDHYVNRTRQIYCLSKLKSKDFYQFYIGNNSVKPTRQNRFWYMFYIYIIFLSIYLQDIFQYKILHNILILTKIPYLTTEPLHEYVFFWVTFFHSCRLSASLAIIFHDYVVVHVI